MATKLAAILPAGSGVTAGVFQFDASDEPIEIEDITVQINGINTSANGYYVVGLAQADATPDTNAVDTVSLFYYDDGTAVKIPMEMR